MMLESPLFLVFSNPPSSPVSTPGMDGVCGDNETEKDEGFDDGIERSFSEEGDQVDDDSTVDPSPLLSMSFGDGENLLRLRPRGNNEDLGDLDLIDTFDICPTCTESSSPDIGVVVSLGFCKLVFAGA